MQPGRDDDFPSGTFFIPSLKFVIVMVGSMACGESSAFISVRRALSSGGRESKLLRLPSRTSLTTGEQWNGGRISEWGGLAR